MGLFAIQGILLGLESEPRNKRNFHNFPQVTDMSIPSMYTFRWQVNEFMVIASLWISRSHYQTKLLQCFSLADILTLSSEGSLTHNIKLTFSKKYLQLKWIEINFLLYASNSLTNLSLRLWDTGNWPGCVKKKIVFLFHSFATGCGIFSLINSQMNINMF